MVWLTDHANLLLPNTVYKLAFAYSIPYLEGEGCSGFSDKGDGVEAMVKRVESDIRN